MTDLDQTGDAGAAQTAPAFAAFLDAMGAHCADEFDTYQVSGPYESLDEYAWEYLEFNLGTRDTAVLGRRCGLPADLSAFIRFDAAACVAEFRRGGTAFGRCPEGKWWAFDYRLFR